MMRKTLLLVSLASVSAAALAQKVTILPNPSDNMYMGQAISANGKYICGTDMNEGMFIADWQSGKVVSAATSDEGMGAELRSVSNDGVAVGYDGPAVTFDMNGTRTALDEQESIAESISADGKYICGSIYLTGYTTQAQLWVLGDNGYAKASLPEPRDAALGYETRGSSARHINADGTTIIGYVTDKLSSYPACAWYMNKDGQSYSVYPISRRFFQASKTGDSRPYGQFYATGVSSNGKWASVQLVEAATRSSRIGRYNLETDSLEVAEFDPSSDSFTGVTIYTSKIADDGTMLFFTQDRRRSRKGAIWKAGDTYPALLSEKYAAATELAAFDEAGMNVPMDITPDGRYITGFGVNAESGSYETYVLDTEAQPTAIEDVKTDNPGDQTQGADSYYTVSGRRVSAPVKGVTIVVNPAGKARKIIVR